MPALLTRIPTASDHASLANAPTHLEEGGDYTPTVRERLALSPRNLVGLGVIIFFALLFAAWLFFSGSPEQASGSQERPQIASSTPAQEVVQTDVVVDVSGKVRRPGVYHLSAGARADDALVAAGGALPGVDLSSINRAEVLADGTQILVGMASSGGSGGLLSLNRASTSELDALPGVGPVLATRIVAWRKAHGRFTSIDQLRDVSGVGDAKFTDLKSLIRL
jgi:competence protein ComEA